MTTDNASNDDEDSDAEFQVPQQPPQLHQQTVVWPSDRTLNVFRLKQDTNPRSAVDVSFTQAYCINLQDVLCSAARPIKAATH